MVLPRMVLLITDMCVQHALDIKLKRRRKFSKRSQLGRSVTQNPSLLTISSGDVLLNAYGREERLCVFRSA